MISRSCAASSASSSSWRSSVRVSRSPTCGSASSRSSPSRGALRGNVPSSSPSRQTTRCGTERIGTSVQIVRWPVRKFARVGRPCRRSASSARISGAPSRAACPAASLTTSVSSRCSSERCQPSSGAVAVSASAASARAFAHARHGLRPVQGVDRGLQAVDELRQPPGELDRAAVDVVERQHAAEQPPLVLVHRHADQQPVQPGAPGARAQRGELERRAVLGVQAPADAALGHPVLEARDVVVVEPEALAHRLAVGEVDHLRRGQPLAGEVQDPRDDAEDRVRLAQRAVREPDPQVGQAARRPKPCPS